METSCPQCRSTNIKQETKLSYATCKYCNNEFYPLTIDDLEKLVQNSTKITLPKYKNPLQIQQIEREENQITLYITGQNGGYYKYILRPNHTGALKRRKGVNERNQFGSRWTNGTSMWPEALE